jgi:hypothetical protein
MGRVVPAQIWIHNTVEGRLECDDLSFLKGEIAEIQVLQIMWCCDRTTFENLSPALL